MFGEMEIVMYDARSDSPTFGLVAKVSCRSITGAW